MTTPSTCHQLPPIHGGPLPYVQFWLFSGRQAGRQVMQQQLANSVKSCSFALNCSHVCLHSFICNRRRPAAVGTAGGHTSQTHRWQPGKCADSMCSSCRCVDTAPLLLCALCLMLRQQGHCSTQVAPCSASCTFCETGSCVLACITGHGLPPPHALHFTWCTSRLESEHPSGELNWLLRRDIMHTNAGFQQQQLPGRTQPSHLVAGCTRPSLV